MGQSERSTIIHALPWPAAWVGRDGALRERNDAAVSFGVDEGPFWNLIEPPDRARAERGWAKAIASGTPFRLDGYVRELDRRALRPCRLEAQPTPGSDDRLLIFVPAAASSARSAPESRYRFAIEAAGTMVYEVDVATGEILAFDGLERILRLCPDRVRTQEDWSRQLHPEDAEQYAAEIERATREDDGFELAYRVRHGDGHLVTLHESGRVLRDERGLPYRRVGVMIDVSDRARAEDTLRRADRNKNELLAMLGHELRNPLAALSSAMDALDESPERAEQLMPVMRRQVRTLGRLVDDLADTARVVRGEIVLRRQPVKLEEVVQHAMQTAMPVLERRGHEPELEIRDESLEAYGDPTRLEQVLVNLLTNASKYTPAGGDITLVLGRDGAEGVIEVRDEGVGIDPELLPTIFDLFTQGAHSFDRAEGGLGIGLSLSRRLAELHGGNLNARSAGQDEGSTFTLRLPLRRNERPPVATPPPVAPPPAERSLRVLVVDDNEDAAEMLAHVLTRSGHEVRTAHDGQRGLEEARQFEPHVAVLDIGLPRKNGYELAMAMRGDPALREARLIALTGYGTREDRERAKRAGFDHHLVKPADASALRELMRPRASA